MTVGSGAKMGGRMHVNTRELTKTGVGQTVPTALWLLHSQQKTRARPPPRRDGSGARRRHGEGRRSGERVHTRLRRWTAQLYPRPLEMIHGQHFYRALVRDLSRTPGLAVIPPAPPPENPSHRPTSGAALQPSGGQPQLSPACVHAWPSPRGPSPAAYCVLFGTSARQLRR
jgi:hypothetical protein